MTQVELYVHATKTRKNPGYNSRGTYYVTCSDICRMRLCLNLLSRVFSNRCVFKDFDKNAQRISVAGRPKRIEMFVFRVHRA